MLKKGWHLYEFGAFRVDPVERLVLANSQRIAVTGKAFDILSILLESAGHLVSKAELIKAVWPNCFVEEGNLAVTISMLRKALGDEGPEYKYIQTVAKQGYRFIGDVREVVLPEAVQEAIPGANLASIPEAPVAPATAPVSDQQPPPRRFSHRGWLVVAAAAIVLSAFAVIAVPRWRSPKAGSGIRSLVVLPFRLSNPDPSLDYLRVGMADAIITRLAETGQIIVRPTTAVFDSANLPADPLVVGREQKADVVLVGRIETSGERLRANVQLVRVVDGSLLWAGSFGSTQAKLFELEQDIEEKVAQAMSVRLSGSDKAGLSGPPTKNPEAYRLYLEGRYFWNKRTEQGLRRSIESFQRAVLEDPRYAAPYAGLADSYTLLASYGVEPAEQAYPNAKAAALKALQLDDHLSEAHTSLGMVSFYYEWNWKQAEQEFRRSIELNPNYALAHTWYALELAAVGRSHEALAQIQDASRLDPLSLSVLTEVGRVYYWNRQYDLAIEAFQKVISLDPQFARAHTRLGIAYVAKKNYSAALREFQQSAELSGSDPYLDGLMGYAQALSGNSAGASEVMTDLAARAKRHQFVPAFSLALVSIGLGDRSGAAEWLDRAYQDRSTYMVYAKVDPLLDPVRSDPRFSGLLQRMGLSR